MSDYLVSIIIPCYNVEKYVSRCIDSLVMQTIGFENLQLILVDDASTDNTLSIIKEYEKKYPDNIIVVSHDINRRQGGARNTGLKYAEADYIGYVDSDDWVEETMYEALYTEMVNRDVDVVKCKFFSDDATNPKSFKLPEKQENQYLEFEKVNGYFFGEPKDNQKGINGIFGGVYTGLYKKDILIDNNISFPENVAYEDNLWWGRLRLYIKNMYLVDVPYYHYFYNTESTVRTKNVAHHLDRINVEEMMLKEYSDKGILSSFHDRLLPDVLERYYLNTFFTLFYRFDESPDVSIYNRISETIYKYFPDWEINTDLTSVPQDVQLLLWWLGKYPSCSQEALNLLREEYLNLIHELYEL